MYKALDFFNVTKVRVLGNLKYQNIIYFGLLIFILPRILERNWIPWYIVAGVIVCGSVLITYTFKDFYGANLGVKWAVLHNLSIGILFLFFVIIGNDVLSSAPVTFKSYNIEEVELEQRRGRKPGRLYFIAKMKLIIDRENRTFTFNYSRIKEQKSQPHKLTLGEKKGFLGFMVIKSVKID